MTELQMSGKVDKDALPDMQRAFDAAATATPIGISAKGLQKVAPIAKSQKTKGTGKGKGKEKGKTKRQVALALKAPPPRFAVLATTLL
eukprot:13323925-Alexandrium_andersonii.AAC.1